tara:strand:- start:310 stop:462 length:153 start_codon:yes stop_codon:yes gene_type:complete
MKESDVKLVAQLFADAIRPYTQRIKALEVEVKAGHTRLKNLEQLTEGKGK